MTRTDPIVADPRTVWGVADRLGEIADLAATSRDQLHTDGALRWRGSAADAFQRELGKLPDDLHKVHDSYSRASTALRRYAGELERLVSASRSAAERVLEDEQNLRVWESYLHDRNYDHAYVRDRVREAQWELDQARTFAERVHGELDDAADICRRALRAASDAGIRDSFGRTFGHVLREIGHGIGHGAEFFGREVLDLVLDPIRGFEAWVEDPTFANLGSALRATAKLVGTVAFVAFIVVTIAGSGGAAAPAWAVALGGAADTLGTVTTLTNVGALAADTAAWRREGRPGNQVALDTIGLAVDGLTRYVGAVHDVGSDGANVVRYGRRLQAPEAPVGWHSSPKLKLHWSTHGDVDPVSLLRSPTRGMAFKTLLNNNWRLGEHSPDMVRVNRIRWALDLSSPIRTRVTEHFLPTNDSQTRQ